MEKTLEGMNVVFSSPTYGPVDPDCRTDSLIATMSASTAGVHWVGCANSDRMPFEASRNFAARVVRTNTGIDGIFWMDSDIRCSPPAIVSLLNTAKTHNLDFVTGVYHTRSEPFLPVLYHKMEDTGCKRGYKYLQCLDYPENTITSISASGFGFCYTSSKMINDMCEHPGFNPERGWFQDDRSIGGFGEDIFFCDLASKAGYVEYVDTSVQVGHTSGARVIWAKDFRDQGINIDDPRIQQRVVKVDWSGNRKTTRL